jgi:hypothetical protein
MCFSNERIARTIASFQNNAAFDVPGKFAEGEFSSLRFDFVLILPERYRHSEVEALILLSKDCLLMVAAFKLRKRK